MSLRRFREGLALGMNPEAADRMASLYKKDAHPPDYGPMAAATIESTRMLKEMSDRQMDLAEEQYAEFSPMMKDIAATQAGIMESQKKQADEYYDFYKTQYRPVEEGLIEDVNNYNTGAERERIATGAGAQVERQASNQRQANARAMASMGVNPNSGKYQGGGRRSAIQTAIAKAGAMTSAREQARQLGHAKKLDVIGLGRGMPGASHAAYGGATAAGSAAGGTTMTPANYLQQGYGQAANTMAGAANANISGNQAILNSQSNWATARANQAGIGDFLGTALATWAGTGFAT